MSALLDELRAEIRTIVRDELRGTLELTGGTGTRAEVKFPV